jgi:hypothetical protein
MGRGPHVERANTQFELDSWLLLLLLLLLLFLFPV